MSVEFSSQRDVTSPTDRVNTDVASSNGRREIVSDYLVSIAISTEYLNAEKMLLLNAPDSFAVKLRCRRDLTPPKFGIKQYNGRITTVKRMRRRNFAER